MYFNVSHFTSISDHCSIKVSLEVDFNVHIFNKTIALEKAPQRYKWASPYKEKSEDLINSIIVKKIFSVFHNKEFPNTQEGIGSAVNEFNETLNYVAQQVFPQHKIKKRTYPASSRKKWYDKNCSSLKAELKRLAKQCSIDPLNTLIRQNFKITKRKYRKLLKKKELQYVHTIRDILIDTLNKDPQSFWNSIKELRKDQCDQDGNNPTELDTWFDYFKALYSKQSQIDGSLENA